MYHHSNLVFKKGDSLPQPKDYSKKNIYTKAACIYTTNTCIYIDGYVILSETSTPPKKKNFTRKLLSMSIPSPTHLRFSHSVTICYARIFHTHFFFVLVSYIRNFSFLLPSNKSPSAGAKFDSLVMFSFHSEIQENKLNCGNNFQQKCFLGIGA